MAFQAQGRWLESRLAPLSFSNFICEITFKINHDLYDEGKPGMCEVLNPHYHGSRSAW